MAEEVQVEVEEVQVEVALADTGGGVEMIFTINFNHIWTQNTIYGEN